MDKVLAQIGDGIAELLTVVISKSGGTKETRNGQLEARKAYRCAGLTFERHAVAVTGEGSELDRTAQTWLARFPMWDWVGGRTSELSAVGLLPAALQGFDITGMLSGARDMDDVTRNSNARQNPAALLALISTVGVSVAFAITRTEAARRLAVAPRCPLPQEHRCR